MFNFQDRSDGDIQVSLGSNYWDNNMLRNSPYASMYDNNGNYEQYLCLVCLPMVGTITTLIVSITIWKRGIPY